jgi:hypothetical protein
MYGGLRRPPDLAKHATLLCEPQTPLQKCNRFSKNDLRPCRVTHHQSGLAAKIWHLPGYCPPSSGAAIVALMTDSVY